MHSRGSNIRSLPSGYPAAEALGPLPLGYLASRFLDFFWHDPYTPGMVDAIAQEFVAGAELHKETLGALASYVRHHESPELKFIWIRLLNPKDPQHKRILMHTLNSKEPGLSVAAGVRLEGTLARIDVDRLLKQLVVPDFNSELEIGLRKGRSDEQLRGYLEAFKGVSDRRVTDFRKLARARFGLARIEI
ncbi:MAG: hypothetical protein K1X83_00650 [Oligoflexia bacterium]|nr:hypothetical protein [Oligoflexia bacterium]